MRHNRALKEEDMCNGNAFNLDHAQQAWIQDNAGNMPAYYTNYAWDGKHRLFGYPADQYPGFDWIRSLEERFKWSRNNWSMNQSAPRHLVPEMIQWGNSLKRSTLSKFEDGLGDVNLRNCLNDVIINLANTCAAIAAARRIPGLGPTYSSKLLRFLDPDNYGALDSQIMKALGRWGIDNGISNYQNVQGYCNYLSFLRALQTSLHVEEIVKPECGLSGGPRWRLADIEMALFSMATGAGGAPIAGRLV
jgi:hypothetical protein